MLGEIVFATCLFLGGVHVGAKYGGIKTLWTKAKAAWNA